MVFFFKGWSPFGWGAAEKNPPRESRHEWWWMMMGTTGRELMIRQRMVVMKGKRPHERTRGREGVVCKKEAGWWSKHLDLPHSACAPLLMLNKLCVDVVSLHKIIGASIPTLRPHNPPFFPHKKRIRGCFTAVAPCVWLLGPLWGRAVIPEGTYESRARPSSNSPRDEKPRPQEPIRL